MAITRVTDDALYCPVDFATHINNQRKLARKQNGDLVCCYLKVSPDGNEDIYCATSTDNGLTWSEERVHTGKVDALCIVPPFPAIAIDSNDNLHIIFTVRLPGSAAMVYYTTKNGGVWSIPIQVNDPPLPPDQSQGQFVAIAVDSLDNIHCIWDGEGFGLNPSDNNMQYKQRTAAGVWLPQETITDLPSYNRMGSIAIDAFDNVHVVWMRQMAIWPWSVTIHYRQRVAGVWQPEENVAPEAPVTDDQECPCIALDSNNQPHVVWHGKGWGAFLTATSVLHRHKVAGVWQSTEVVMNHQFGGIDKDRQYPTICIDANDDVWVAAYGNGDLAMDFDNIYYDVRPFSAVKGILLYNAVPRQKMPIMIWAFYPIINSVHTNVPSKRFALIWTINQSAAPPPFPTPEVLFADAVVKWPTPLYSQCSELVDGYMEMFDFPWSACHDVPSCVAPACAIQDAEEHLLAIAAFFPGIPDAYYLCRAWLYFDTSSIPSNAIITKAILALLPEHIAEDTPGYATLHIVEGVQATPLQPDDWGNHLNKIISGGSIAFADWFLGVYNPIELNAIGRSWINKGGITRFCLRVASDINNTPPLGPGMNDNSIQVYSADMGFLYCPLFHVEYILSVIEVITNPATNITDRLATLNGLLVNDGGEACEVRFQWGLTTAYGNDTPWQSGKHSGDAFAYNLLDLEPDTTYHFRAQARNSVTSDDGLDMTFKTLKKSVVEYSILNPPLRLLLEEELV